MTEAADQKAAAFAADLERREQLFLEYHGSTAWARAKIDSGTLYITEEAETYMRREIEFRNAERDRMEQLRKEDLEHHGHDNEAETRTADSIGRSIVAGTVPGDRSRSRQLYSDHSEQPNRGSGNATDGVQPGPASDAGNAGGPAAGNAQPAPVAGELRPAIGGDSAVAAPAAD